MQTSLFTILLALCLIGLALARLWTEKRDCKRKASPAPASRCRDEHDPHNPPNPPLVKISCAVEEKCDADDEHEPDAALVSPLKLSADEAPSSTSSELAKLPGLSTTSENTKKHAITLAGADRFPSNPPCAAQINAAAFSSNAHLLHRHHSSHIRRGRAALQLHTADHLPHNTAQLQADCTSHTALSNVTQCQCHTEMHVEAAPH
ncbi:hypothetical protein CERZMDRAFT_81814 [Cercospora zeae-maydis SCOH1-5]|uniref:Secreted protein n=1 Tax=Cercospora zeae-maydis SCOH1-5 TaxID=717836 RepID=A0A6A6FQQ9_9PEZI|nr:hypothetical protein CERZMDRAFT_81814 [Cercospora zeae-maydis SCOH1-5]